jgi:putative membrane protein
MEIADLPHLLAALNTMTALFLLAGYYFIRQKNRVAHKRCMVSALLLGVTFLAIYIYYHANAGLAKFGGEGTVRTIYFSILIVHIIMALFSMGLVPVTAFIALRGNFKRHARIARLTLPVWLFVSASGVVIYAMAVHLYPWTGG